jgi:hypothetical protein
VRAGLIGKVFCEGYSQRGSPPNRLAPIDCIRIKVIPIGPNYSSSGFRRSHRSRARKMWKITQASIVRIEYESGGETARLSNFTDTCTQVPGGHARPPNRLVRKTESGRSGPTASLLYQTCVRTLTPDAE